MKHEIFPKTETIDFSKPLRVKFGIDPTSDKLHLGHLIPLLAAKELFDKGHHVDIVLGTFTAQLGDPSGKDTMRPILDKETTETNAMFILAQVNRIFGNMVAADPKFNSLQFHLNGTWFNEMTAVEMTKILSNFTTSQLLARDSFQKRIKNEDPIGMHELVVPILQGFDSVHLNSDIEIGGNDQLFNFKITRDLQKAFGDKPEICLLMPIINGTDGRKMSKSFGNCIFLNDTPEDVFGKTMSISDDLMKEWLQIFFSDEPLDEKMGPMAMKKELAFEITKLIWSVEDAGKALQHFESVIQQKNNPQEFINVMSGTLLSVVSQIRKCSSTKSRRLLTDGAVRVNDNKVFDENFQLKSGDIVKIGKLDFAKVN